MKQIAELIEGRPLIHAESSDKVRVVAQKMSDRTSAPLPCSKAASSSEFFRSAI